MQALAAVSVQGSHNGATDRPQGVTAKESQPGAVRVELWTDGSGTQRGPGGWAFVLRAIDIGTGELVKHVERAGGVADTTNNRMELQALLEGLRALQRPARVHVYSDSQYVTRAWTDDWLTLWIRRDWRKVHNVDLWQQILAAAAPHELELTWIPGHSGIELNELCDRLAGEQRRALLSEASA